jgi:hypothetical protein
VAAEFRRAASPATWHVCREAARVRQNLKQTHGLIVAEAGMMGLADYLGRDDRQAASSRDRARLTDPVG